MDHPQLRAAAFMAAMACIASEVALRLQPADDVAEFPCVGVRTCDARGVPLPEGETLVTWTALLASERAQGWVPEAQAGRGNTACGMFINSPTGVVVNINTQSTTIDPHPVAMWGFTAMGAAMGTCTTTTGQNADAGLPDRINVAKSGTYLINLGVSATGPNNAEIEVIVKNSGVDITQCEFDYVLQTAGPRRGAVSCLANLKAGQAISGFLENYSSTADITVEHSSFNAILLN